MKTARLAVSFAVLTSLAGCVQATPEPPDVRSTSQPVTVADGQPENTTAKGSATPVTKSPQVIQALETQPILRTTWQRKKRLHPIQVAWLQMTNAHCDVYPSTQ